MKNPLPKERRGHQRVVVSFPVNVRLDQGERAYPGMTIDASQSGLLIQTLKDMSLETTLDVELLFPKGSKFPHLKTNAKIIWKDICNWEDLEGYQYGVKFIQISDQDYSILKELLADPLLIKEAELVDRAERETTLVVKVER